MKQLQLLLLSLLLIGNSKQLLAQGSLAPKYSNEFLSIGVGADALGMGNAVVAQSNSAFSTYWNPAGILGVNKWLEIGGMHSEYFAGIAKYDFLSGVHSIDNRSAIGLSMMRFAVDNIPNTTQLIDQQGNIDYSKVTSFSAADYAFLLTYARKSKVPGLDIGGNIKIIHRVVGGFAHSWGLGLDAGIQYELKNKLKLGILARDVSSTFNAWAFTLDEETKTAFTLTNNEIPTNGVEITLPRFILAAYKKFEFGKRGFYTSGEVDLDITSDGMRNTLIRGNRFSYDPRLGINFGFKNILVLRTGLSNFQHISTIEGKKQINFQPSIGIGLNIKNFYLDYGFTDIGNTSVALYSHVLSVRIRLDKPKNMLK